MITIPIGGKRPGRYDIFSFKVKAGSSLKGAKCGCNLVRIKMYVIIKPEIIKPGTIASWNNIVIEVSVVNP